MFTVDLHLKNETTDTAIYHLEKTLELMRKSHEKVGCLIVGYGSTGGTHKIRNAVLDVLAEKEKKHQIRGFIIGSEIDIFNVKYQNLKGKELIDNATKKRKNPGEIIIIL